MRHVIVLSSVLCGVAFAIAQDSSSEAKYKEVVEKMIASMTQITETLESISDEDTARAKRSVLRVQVNSFLDARKMSEAIAPPSAEVREKLGRVWARLRGQPIPEPQRAAYLERLQNRKTAVDESLNRDRAVRRFESAGPGGLAPPIADVSAPLPSAPRPAARADGGLAPTPEGETAADFAERLKQAKKRAWEERKDT